MSKQVLTSLSVILLASVVFAATSAAAETRPPSADDFVPPGNGGPTEVEKPDLVKVSGEVVTAATAQDAINAAVAQNKQKFSGNGDQPVDGAQARLVQFPSGLGVVATGVGTYEDTGDAVLNRISQRHAYVVAFMEAKQNLAVFLKGLSHEGQELLRQQTVSIGSAAGHLNNVSSHSQVSVKQAVEHLLRSFVIYEVADEPKTKRVFVSIASTPKTCQKVSRSSAAAIEAGTLQEGLNQLLAEVRAGVAFPVGSRIIAVPATGETAVVGFGSQVVRTDAQEAVAARLRLNAQKMAAALSRDSLCGMLVGDKVAWEGKYSEQVRQDFAAFDDVAKDEVLAPTDLENVKRLERRRESVMAEVRATDSYRSVREGQLPPGVVVKTWFNEDGSWAHGMSVYVPSLTRGVMGIAARMRDAQWIEPAEEQGEAAEGTLQGRTPSTTVPAERTAPATPLQRGPTGRVNPKDL